MSEENVIQLRGKRYVLYAGLLGEAHHQGLRSIDEELEQVPDATNDHTAIIKATVELSDPDTGEIKSFSGIGDANPANVGKNIAPHLIRMASTRAKARAFRDALNTEGAADETEYEDAPASEEPATEGQIATLENLAFEWRGEEGVARLERRIEKDLDEMTRAEADEWIKRLSK